MRTVRLIPLVCSRVQRHFFGMLTVLLFGSASFAQPFEYDPIFYVSTPVNDRIKQLQDDIEAGNVELKRDDKHGWLKAVLDALEIPIESQVLVFSESSLQTRYISPKTPRAVYFGDDVYVGWVQGGPKLEISGVDPKQGAIFYHMNQNDRRPVIKRDKEGECLACHAAAETQSVPGYMVESVYADKRGRLILDLPIDISDHTSSFEERFGGWYVTGKYGSMRHRGNQIASRSAKPPIDPEPGANLTDVTQFFPSKPYLTTQSDVVALMVLQHQTQMHNMITKANYETRRAFFYERKKNKEIGRPLNTRLNSTNKRIERSAEKLVKYLLFANEAKLESPVTGTTSFAEDFSKKGPHDSKGRSLKQLDMKTRMFKYPCSFLIYSESFDALPKEVLTYVNRRINEVLSGEDKSSDFSHLSAADRKAIREILMETKPSLKLKS